MRKIAFLGNSASVHLGTWRKIYKSSSVPVSRLFTIHPAEGLFEQETKIHFFVKHFSYVFLGLYVRLFFRKKIDLLHAHGGSGYGLSALVSGVPYVVTVYGSEVLKGHSVFYRLMMKMIFSRARMITVTSRDAERKILSDGFLKDAGKIAAFHTGLDFSEIDEIRKNFFPVPGRRKTILSVRNTAEHYRTESIIEAFCQVFPEGQEEFELKIILGNGSGACFENLRKAYDRPDIVYVGGKIQHKEMIEEILGSSICVSFPETDQLSATLLEVVYSGKPLLSSDLESYEELKVLTTGSDMVKYVPDRAGLVVELRRMTQVLSVNVGPSEGGSLRVSERFSIQGAAHFFSERLGRI